MVDARRALRSLDRSKELVVAAVYRREIGASLERVWENVHDWAHLPYLHSQAFHAIEKLDAGPWGWHARIGIGPADSGAEIELELVTDEPALRYVSRTLTGAGAPSEIWTELGPVAADRTTIQVEFCVPAVPPDALEKIGEGYLSLYALLWDQDEAMMQTRSRALAAGPRPSPSTSPATASRAAVAPLALGSLDRLRPRLPLVVEFGGERFRLVDVEGELVAHAVECPHLLGPLERSEVVAGTLACPWHGYAFDVRTGRSCDGRGLRLAAAPRVRVDPETGEVELRSRAGRAS